MKNITYGQSNKEKKAKACQNIRLRMHRAYVYARRRKQTTGHSDVKVRGPFVQTLCIEKDSHMDTINRVNMMLCYSKIRKIKYFLDPPPPKKKAQGYERS